MRVEKKITSWVTVGKNETILPPVTSRSLDLPVISNESVQYTPMIEISQEGTDVIDIQNQHQYLWHGSITVRDTQETKRFL